jgi:hypothetical protein
MNITVPGTSSQRTITASGTVRVTDDVVFVDATAGAVTLTLLAASRTADRKITVKKIDASANAVTIAGVSVSSAGSISGTTMTITGTPTGGFEPGMLVTGAGVTAGTTITAFGTAVGGTGTYTVSVSQTVSNTTLTATDVIDGAVTQALSSQYSALALTSNGGKYSVIGKV